MMKRKNLRSHESGSAQDPTRNLRESLMRDVLLQLPWASLNRTMDVLTDGDFLWNRYVRLNSTVQDVLQDPPALQDPQGKNEVPAS